MNELIPRKWDKIYENPTNSFYELIDSSEALSPSIKEEEVVCSGFFCFDETILSWREVMQVASAAAHRPALKTVKYDTETEEEVKTE